MPIKVNAMMPCVTFFSAGKPGAGLATLGMQASLVLWPMAYRMAREFNESSAVDEMLSQLSVTYQLPAHVVMDRPSKRFRQTADNFVPAPARQVA